jgi:hypothetical protein
MVQFLESNRRRWLGELAPYAAFTILIIIYNYLFLGQGFNGTDEGYLLSLGERVVHGQAPYHDFFFLRTPLSIYIQGGLIALFGDSYTVLASRIYWTVEMWGMALVVSTLYRRLVGRLETLLLLTVTYIASTQLLSFPWYSYDAAFFAVVAVVLLTKKQYLAAGIAAFLAAMAKQNYAFLLPVYFALTWAFQWRLPKYRYLNLKNAVLVACGFAVPLVLYLLYLRYQGSLWLFGQNIFVLPQQGSRVSIGFTLFQNNHLAAALSAPLIAAIGLLFYCQRRSAIRVVLVCLLLAASLFLAFQNYLTFIFMLVYMNYSLLAVTLVELYRQRKNAEEPPIVELIPALIGGIVIQYLAGFNYAGVEYGYMTCGLGIAAGYVSFREFSHSPSRRLIGVGLLVGALMLGLYYKYDVVYRDGSRSELTAEFMTPKLKGIKSTSRNVEQVDRLVDAVNQYAASDSSILVIPDFPILYYLTGKRNATPMEWYTERELSLRMVPEALASLERNSPKLVLVQTYPEGDFRRSGKQIPYRSIQRYVPFIEYIAKRYKLLNQVGDVLIFSRNEETAPKS